MISKEVVTTFPRAVLPALTSEVGGFAPSWIGDGRTDSFGINRPLFGNSGRSSHRFFPSSRLATCRRACSLKRESVSACSLGMVRSVGICASCRILLMPAARNFLIWSPDMLATRLKCSFASQSASHRSDQWQCSHCWHGSPAVGMGGLAMKASKRCAASPW